MSRVGIYVEKGSGHAEITCGAMAEGIKSLGNDISLFRHDDYNRRKLADVEYLDAAVFWGYKEPQQNIMSDFNASGKPAIYLDLAYWERGTHYKVSIASRHPTAYFQKVKHDAVRRKQFKIEPSPDWNTMGYILVAGMGPKAAWAEKEEPVESWERNAISTLKQFTDRPIVYRPKPSQHYGHPIMGTELDVTTPIEKAIRRSWAVVTHHSNVGVDGLVLGVPVFTMQGVAVPMGLQELRQIESPKYPEDREQWLNDVAYCQWSVDEMKDGTVWRHLLSEGLVK